MSVPPRVYSNDLPMENEETKPGKMVYISTSAICNEVVFLFVILKDFALTGVLQSKDLIAPGSKASGKLNGVFGQLCQLLLSSAYSISKSIN